MRRFLAVLLVLLPVGCSIMDPSDRQELRDRIRSMPENQVSALTIGVMKAAGLRYINNEYDFDDIGRLECRLKEDGAWGDWYDQNKTYRVIDMRTCLFPPNGFTWMMCIELWQEDYRVTRGDELKGTSANPDSLKFECRFAPNPGYEPEKLPPRAIDSKAVGIDDIIDWLVAQPSPPPGWAFPELVPLLCPLGGGPGWGCPPRPDDPIQGQPTENPSGQPGDHP